MQTKGNKRNTLSLLILFWMGSFGVFGQDIREPDWKWQNPSPTGNELHDVQFIDSCLQLEIATTA